MFYSSKYFPTYSLSLILISVCFLSIAHAKRVKGAQECEQVNAWAQAQRENNFKAYSMFYAQSGFTGVKRTKNKKEKKFNRADWLKDRKKMFKPSMAVYVENCRVESTKKGAVSVHFTQYFRSASGNYADQGKKELVFKKNKIIREDMLSSSKWDGILGSSTSTQLYHIKLTTKVTGQDDESETSFYLEHGPQGKAMHGSVIAVGAGRIMGCSNGDALYQCGTALAGEMTDVSVNKVKNQVQVRVCYSDGQNRDCETPLSFKVPPKASIDFKAMK